MSRETFDAIDKNGDGFITLDELIEHLRPTEGAIDAMYKGLSLAQAADADGDKKISFEEYERVIAPVVERDPDS